MLLSLVFIAGLYWLYNRKALKELDPHIVAIFQKYLDGKHTAQELDILLQHFGLPGESDNLKGLIEQQFEKTKPSPIDESELKDMVAEMQVNIHKAINPPKRGKYFIFWYAAAAVLFFFSIATSTYLVIHKKKENQTLTSKFGEDVLPGGKQAYITLSNGKRIDLDSSQSLVKTIDGKILYANGEELSTNTASEIATINTPIGGEYQLILPDGTKAWLNAASSLKYPTRFTEKERSIEVQGEVYLEVANDMNKPFIVQSAQQRIEVLGTAFNIRNYTGNAITTLVHGKIALENNATKEKVILTPGNQSTVSGQSIKVSKVDPSDYLDWKDGSFTIKDATLFETCQELERWYGVTFNYPTGFKNTEKALIMVNRTEKLSEVLEALQSIYKVDFEIRGREVIVK